MVETPVIVNADTAKNAYRGIAMSQLRILKQEMKLGGLAVSARTITLDNGVVIQCKKVFKKEEIFITVPVAAMEKEERAELLSGFAIQPRSGLLKAITLETTDNSYTVIGIAIDGFTKTAGVWTAIAGSNLYNITDEDKETFVVVPKTGKVKWANGSDNYGNNYWLGEGTVISWKGNPSVQFPVPPTINIPGLSQLDGSIYTVFSNRVYAKGQIIAESPDGTRVVGAFAKKLAGIVYLILLVVADKENDYCFQVHRVYNNVASILYEECGKARAKVSASISKAGNLFLYDGTLYTINDVLNVVTKLPSSPIPGLYGQCEIDGTGGYESNFKYEGAGYCWPGMSPDEQLAYSSFKVDASFTGTGNGGEHKQTAQVPVYRGNPATEVFIQAGYSSGIFSFRAVMNGNYCDIRWTGVDGHDDTTAWKEPSGACDSSFVVSVTLIPNNVTALYTYDGPAMLDVTISGPESGVTTAQYTATNTVGDVTWTNSSGSISDSGLAVFTGCGTAVITATDACGRSASKKVRLNSGYWQLQSSVYNYDNCNGTFSATYISGDTKIFMLFYANCACIKSMNNYSWCQSETVPQSNYPVPFIPDAYTGVCEASAAPYGSMYYNYYGYWLLTACHVAVYSWVCP